jgi:photosystem II stability/assembly factor-like uncharacterized protein
MKNLIVCIILSSAGCGTSSAEAPLFTEDLSVHTSFHSTLAGVVSPGVIITAGWYGYIHRSTDAGRSWEKRSNGVKNNYALEITGNTILTGSEGKRPARSIDGGSNWELLPETGLDAIYKTRFISSPDGNHIWISDRQHVFSLNHSEQAWKQVPLPSAAEPAGLTLCTDTAWILDSRGVLFQFTDDGTTWKKRYRLSDPERFDLSANEVAQSYIRMEKTGRGIMLLYQRTPLRWCAFTTVDGGITWRERSMPQIQGVVYLSRDGTILTVRTDSKSIAVYRRLSE